jgi:hypothetical protein
VLARTRLARASLRAANVLTDCSRPLPTDRAVIRLLALLQNSARGRTARLEPVSVSHRTGLCSRRQFLPGNGLASAETWQGFSAAVAYSTRERLGSLASPAPKPREVKDYSDHGGKPSLRGTAWWAREGHHHRAISKVYPHKHPLKPIYIGRKGHLPAVTNTAPLIPIFGTPKSRHRFRTIFERVLPMASPPHAIGRMPVIARRGLRAILIGPSNEKTRRGRELPEGGRP